MVYNVLNKGVSVAFGCSVGFMGVQMSAKTLCYPFVKFFESFDYSASRNLGLWDKYSVTVGPAAYLVMGSLSLYGLYCVTKQHFDETTETALQNDAGNDRLLKNTQKVCIAVKTLVILGLLLMTTKGPFQLFNLITDSHGVIMSCVPLEIITRLSLAIITSQVDVHRPLATLIQKYAPG